MEDSDDQTRPVLLRLYDEEAPPRNVQADVIVDHGYASDESDQMHWGMVLSYSIPIQFPLQLFAHHITSKQTVLHLHFADTPYSLSIEGLEVGMELNVATSDSGYDSNDADEDHKVIKVNKPLQHYIPTHS